MRVHNVAADVGMIILMMILIDVQLTCLSYSLTCTISSRLVSVDAVRNNITAYIAVVILATTGVSSTRRALLFSTLNRFAAQL